MKQLLLLCEFSTNFSLMLPVQLALSGNSNLSTFWNVNANRITCGSSVFSPDLKAGGITSTFL